MSIETTLWDIETKRLKARAEVEVEVEENPTVRLSAVELN